MEMSHADRGCMRQEDCFAVPPEPGSQLMVRPAFKPRPGQGRQQPTTGDGSRQRDSRQARIPSAGLGTRVGVVCRTQAPCGPCVLSAWQQRHCGIVLRRRDKGSNAAAPGRWGDGVCLMGWWGGAISDKPLAYDTCEVISLSFADSGWTMSRQQAGMDGRLQHACATNTVWRARRPCDRAQAKRALEGEGLGRDGDSLEGFGGWWTCRSVELITVYRSMYLS